MRRLVAALATCMVLMSCASPFAKKETPDQALGAAAQTMQDVKTAKFDLDGTADVKLPPALAQIISQQAGSQLPAGLTLDNLVMKITANGEARFPDQSRITIQMRLGGFSVSTGEVMVGTKIYLKDPISGKWTVVTAPGMEQLGSQFNQLDPLTVKELLSAYQTVTDLGDSKIGDASVHHYKLVPDKTKLGERLDKSPALQNPLARAAVRQLLDRGTFVVEVWIGVQDHLLRKVTADGDQSADLNQLSAAFGPSSGTVTRPGATPTPLPPGSEVRVKFHTSLEFHDFNAPVTITEPKVG